MVHGRVAGCEHSRLVARYGVCSDTDSEWTDGSEVGLHRALVRLDVRDISDDSQCARCRVLALCTLTVRRMNGRTCVVGGWSMGLGGQAAADVVDAALPIPAESRV